MDTIENGAVVIAVVHAIKTLVPNQVQGIVTIIVAALVGALLAFVRNGDILNGVFSGLASAGVITAATRVGK